MEPNTRGFILMAKSRVKVVSSGRTGVSSMESFWTTISMEMAFMSGLTGGSMLGSGSSTKCGGKVYLRGLITECMREITMTIRNRGKEDLCGLMGECMLGAGLMESKMDLGSTLRPREI